ncbi:MAG: acyltransferase family protein [Pseudomonadota bacterium]
MKYRADIDGLRACAILPVLFYHAGLPFFSGGFVGVDVFFVISGFLITRIVADEVTQKRFSLIGFYERRARRILPALIAMIFASLAAGWFVLLTDEYVALGESTVAAALFYSNVHFALSFDYFARAAEFNPLLHTWSLAVEEQFYLFFPPLLMLLLAIGRRQTVLIITIVLCIVSLICAEYVLHRYHSIWSFYLLPFRAWELGLGAVLALASWSPPRNRLIREFAGIVGLIGVLVPTFAYSADTQFPGLYAVPPTLGTALLIYVGGQGGGSVSNSIISHRVLVSIGLISYSLYLWHWPVFAYLRILYGTTALPIYVSLIAMALSILLAYASWRFIEQPFRFRPPKGPSRSLVMRLSVSFLVVVSAIGASLSLLNGFPHRLSEKAIEIASVAQDVNPIKTDCQHASPEPLGCEFGASDSGQASYDFLFWGDSHANALAPGIAVSASEHNKSGVFATRSACAPVFNIQRTKPDRACVEFLENVRSFLDENQDIPLIILSARWALSVEGNRYPVDGNGTVRLQWVGGQDESPLNASNSSVFEAGMRHTLSHLSSPGRRIVILGPVPEVTFDVPIEYARAELLNANTMRSLPYNTHLARVSQTEGIFEKLAASDPNIEYISLSSLLCDEIECRVVSEDGVPLYTDDDHLSATAARSLLPLKLETLWGAAD